MPLAGAKEREQAVRILRRAYANEYLAAPELERRLDLALRARTSTELGRSVRGIPGALLELAVRGVAAPALRRGTLGLRVRAARLLRRVAIGGWMLVTGALGAVAAVSALTAELSAGVGVALALVWLAATGIAYAISRGARRLARPEEIRAAG